MGKRLTKQFLDKWYSEKGLSTWAIEKRFGISRGCVYSTLKKYRIPTRNVAQSHVRYARADFSGNKRDRAYLLGFSIGDLRVRTLNKKQSETISIGCGSTKHAQIVLIEKLFSPYGRVWKGVPDRRGAVNIEAFVNKSFSFLLPRVRSYRWCVDTADSFFSFLSGFTDAEGSFFISNGKAFISWGNYNRNVLLFIKRGLLKFGIESPALYRDSLRGYVGAHGYRRNKNYWHLTITRKAMVKELLDRLETLTLHADKKRALVRLRRNLIMRGLAI